MIREKIIQVMEEKSIRAVDISTALDINRASLSLFLNGKRALKIESIEKILIYLGIKLELE